MRRTRALTWGCITVFSAMSVGGLYPVLPQPYGLLAAASLTLFYGGLIAVFGHGSMIEMGLFAFVILVLCVLLAVAVQSANGSAAEQTRDDRLHPSGGPGPNSTPTSPWVAR